MTGAQRYIQYITVPDGKGNLDRSVYGQELADIIIRAYALPAGNVETGS